MSNLIPHCQKKHFKKKGILQSCDILISVAESCGLLKDDIASVSINFPKCRKWSYFYIAPFRANPGRPQNESGHVKELEKQVQLCNRSLCKPLACDLNRPQFNWTRNNTHIDCASFGCFSFHQS